MHSVCAYEACGASFEGKREDARYCSAVCRAKASRDRRRGDGTDPVPSRDALRAHGDDERLVRIEERLMDLEGDVRAAEEERDAVRSLERRLNSIDTVARRVAEAVVAPIARDLDEVKAELVSRTEYLDLLETLERLEQAARDRPQPAVPAKRPADDSRLTEVERAIRQLTRGLHRLREDFETLIRGIAEE